MYKNIDILIEIESRVKIYETLYNPFIPELNNPNSVVFELERCTEAKFSTIYYYNEYYCTNCIYFITVNFLINSFVNIFILI